LFFDEDTKKPAALRHRVRLILCKIDQVSQAQWFCEQILCRETGIQIAIEIAIKID